MWAGIDVVNEDKSMVAVAGTFFRLDVALLEEEGCGKWAICVLWLTLLGRSLKSRLFPSLSFGIIISSQNSYYFLPESCQSHSLASLKTLVVFTCSLTVELA